MNTTTTERSEQRSGFFVRRTKRRLRVVHVIGSFEVGGAERYALQLAVTQAGKGHDVSVVALGPGPLEREFSGRGVRLHTVSKALRLDPTLPPRLAALFARQRADVVHTHNPPPLVYASLAARSVGALLVHTKHGINRDLSRRLVLRRTAGRLVQSLVAVSEETRRAAIEQGEAKPERTLVIPNGVDTNLYRPMPEARPSVRASLGVSHEDRVIGTVARLVPEKNLDLLMRAAAPMLRDGSTRLVLVGDGPERSKLEATARSIAVDDRVHFTGTRLDTPRLLSAMDVFAMSSKTEGLPLALLEAMSSGLPVVATAVGGIPQLLAGREVGAVVPPKDEAALRRALAKLLDPIEGARAGQFARDWVTANYGLEAACDRTLSLYGELLGHARPEPSEELREDRRAA